MSIFSRSADRRTDSRGRSTERFAPSSPLKPLADSAFTPRTKSPARDEWTRDVGCSRFRMRRSSAVRKRTSARGPKRHSPEVASRGASPLEPRRLPPSGRGERRDATNLARTRRAQRPRVVNRWLTLFVPTRDRLRWPTWARRGANDERRATARKPSRAGVQCAAGEVRPASSRSLRSAWAASRTPDGSSTTRGPGSGSRLGRRWPRSPRERGCPGRCLPRS